jgi:hypothetical protein
VLDPDGIPNKILIILSPEILEGLTYAINRILIKNTLSNYYKELIIIILRKENKKDYSFPSSYRLITLENILAKVVKKILVIRLNRAAEKYIFFL